MIFLGQTDARLPYAVMFLVCAAGAAAVAFLPETLGAKLPETLEEASVFGIHDKFFSYLPSKFYICCYYCWFSIILSFLIRIHLKNLLCLRAVKCISILLQNTYLVSQTKDLNIYTSEF